MHAIVLARVSLVSIESNGSPHRAGIVAHRSEGRVSEHGVLVERLLAQNPPPCLHDSKSGRQSLRACIERGRITGYSSMPTLTCQRLCPNELDGRQGKHFRYSFVRFLGSRSVALAESDDSVGAPLSWPHIRIRRGSRTSLIISTVFCDLYRFPLIVVIQCTDARARFVLLCCPASELERLAQACLVADAFVLSQQTLAPLCQGHGDCL